MSGGRKFNLAEREFFYLVTSGSLLMAACVEVVDFLTKWKWQKFL
jgi:hypothetical protein